MVLRKTLRLEDSKGVLIALLVTHAQQVLREKLRIIIAELKALFPKEKFEGDSTKLSEFLALHFSWYYRYAESVSVRLLLILYLLKYW